MIKIVIFDLDDTLINTSCFKPLRDSGQWSQLDNYIDKFTEIRNAKEAIDLLREKEIIVVIITTSVNDYAKKILSNFEIEYDELFGYHELEEHYVDYTSSKTGSICHLRQKYNLKSNQILFIGDSYKDYKACEETNTLFMTHQDSEAYKDFSGKVITLDSYKNLIPFIESYPSESFSMLNIEHEHLGNVTTMSYYLTDIYAPIPNTRYAKKEDFENNSPSENAMDNTGLPKFSFDAMHKRIKDLKDQKQKSLVNLINTLEQIDLTQYFINIKYVVRALSSNELQYNKFNITAMDILGFYIANKLDAVYQPDILEQNETHEKFSSQTGLRYEERKKIIEGNYSAKELKETGNILVIDDVITTGATTEEIIRAIQETNPSKEIQLFSIAISNKYTEDKYIQNINNTVNFVCGHPTFKDKKTYSYYLLTLLHQNIEESKIFNNDKGIYLNRILQIDSFEILGSKHNYIFCSCNKENNSIKYHAFNTKYACPLYRYHEPFFDKCIK